MSRGTLDPARCLWFSHTGLSPCLAGFPKTVLLTSSSLVAVHNPKELLPWFGLFPFRSPLLRKSNFFLFLRVLRCFSSPGSLGIAMDSRYRSGGLLHWVSPFGNPRVKGYLLLTVAYRSLSRPSSALSAKASTLRSFLLDLMFLLKLLSKDVLPSVAAQVYSKKLNIFRCFCIYYILV